MGILSEVNLEEEMNKEAKNVFETLRESGLFLAGPIQNSSRGAKQLGWFVKGSRVNWWNRLSLELNWGFGLFVHDVPKIAICLSTNTIDFEIPPKCKLSPRIIEAGNKIAERTKFEVTIRHLIKVYHG